MELMRRKVCGEVRKAWTCEITWFLDQVAGLDERLHYIVINDLILFDDEDPATYYIKLVNRGDKEFSVTSNAAIAQGIFLEYGITDDDDAKATRNGGFGSTDKNE